MGLDKFRSFDTSDGIIGFEPGGAFTQSLLQALRGVQSGDLTGTDALDAAFGPAALITQAINDDGARRYNNDPEAVRQHPQRYRRPLADDEYCETGSENVTIN